MLLAFSVINGTLLSLNSSAEFDFLEFLRSLETAEPSEMGGIIMRKPSGETKYIPARFLENSISAVIPKECGVIILTKDGKWFMIPKKKVLGNEKIIERLMGYSYSEEQKEWLCNEARAHDMNGFNIDFIDIVKIFFARNITAERLTRSNCRKVICNLSESDKKIINEIYNIIIRRQGLVDKVVEADEAVSVGKLEFIMENMNMFYIDKMYQDMFFEIIEKTFGFRISKRRI